MNISIIGSGNAASVLARLCVRQGHKINHVLARNRKAAQELAEEVSGHAAGLDAYLEISSDIIIIALSDNSLSKALEGFYFKDIPVVHTSGAVSIHLLKNIADNYGVLYPLQSLRKEMTVIPPIPFLIEANNEGTLRFIQHFANSLSDNVKEEGEDNRLKLHVAAVVVNNFTNYLYTLAEVFCKNENVDFNLLKPLIKETAERIQDCSPGVLQTGPAIRNDLGTIEKHFNLLNKYPKLHDIYIHLTKDIQDEG